MRNGLAGTGRRDAARKALQRRSGFFLALAASTALVAVPAMATQAPTIEELAGGGGGQGGYDSTLGQGAAGAGGAARVWGKGTPGNAGTGPGGGGGGGSGKTGGAGGASSGTSISGAGGAGGNHGYSDETFHSTGATGTDGTNGTGSSDENGGGGGGGGGGGFGAVIEGNGNLGTIAGSLTGGAGGNTVGGSGVGGAGGAGGGGLYILSTGGAFGTIGTNGEAPIAITGGKSGNGGAHGGSGIYVVNTGEGTVTALTINPGVTVTGGEGNTNGHGVGGIGIGGKSLQLMLYSGATVSGGLGGDEDPMSGKRIQANAIQFLGGQNNVLALMGDGTGYATINGNVVAAAADTLSFGYLGGTFNLSKLGSGNNSDKAQFQGFGKVQVKSLGVWTMTGEQRGQQEIAYRVEGGTLQLGDADNKASINANVTVTDGAILAIGAKGAAVTGASSTGVVVQSGGTLKLQAVSAGPALTLNSALDLQAGSTFNVTLGAPSDTPLVKGLGNLTHAGALVIASNDGFGAGTYRLAQVDGESGISGKFSSITGPEGTDYEYSETLSSDNSSPILLLTVAEGGVYWNGSAISGGLVGGDGTWKADDTKNWTNTRGSTNVAWTQGKAAVFAGSAGTVTVNNGWGDVRAKSLKFVTTGYTIGGDTLTLADGTDTPKINVVDSAALATISAPLAGTHGLEKVGDGTLVLTGANTYTGGTTITAGTLQIGTGGSVTGDIVNKTALVFDHTNNLTYAGAISAAGTLTKKGTGTLTLTGTHSYSGETSVAGGTLSFAGGASVLDAGVAYLGKDAG
ncbi:autotransporter-associated beta strand repeat-containing protein [Methylorubrum populi]